MRNKRTVWLLLIFFLVSMLGAMAWISRTLIGVDEEQNAAYRNAAMEQNIRLAMWRMDARAMLIINAALSSDNSWASRYVEDRFVYDLETRSYVTKPKVDIPAIRVTTPPARTPFNAPPSPQEDEQPFRNNLETIARIRLRQAGADFATFWLEERLVAVRRQGSKVTGVLLNWNSFRVALITDTKGLLTDANLRKIVPGVRPERTLASVPAFLETGQTPAFFYELETSPAQLMLLVAWSCMLLPAIGLAVLLLAAYSLNERRDAFVSAVTHELRTPLTTFAMYAEMLESGMVPPEKYPEYFNTLHREATRLNHLVENVLVYARIERGKMKETVESIRLGELLDRIVPVLEQRTMLGEMQMDLNIADRTSPLAVDPAAIERILVNLIDNACKYAGGVENKTIEISTDTVAGKCRISVRDHGPGIADKTLRKLFVPFNKSDKEAAASAPGVGLGLALCRRLARRLDGDLALEETGETGTCFVLTLPIVEIPDDATAS